MTQPCATVFQILCVSWLVAGCSAWLYEPDGVDARRRCGDGVCSRNETCNSCPMDCGQCEVDVDAGVPDLDTPTPESGARGPQATITCPAGSVDIAPGTAIQSVINAHAGGTTYCLRAGVFAVTSAITPRTGDTFVGEYGAILDGSGWATNDGTQAAFRAHNQDIDDVTIQNLVIRNMPQNGIHAFKDFADRWHVDHTEIAYSGVAGVALPNGGTVRNSFIHHSTISGYGAYLANDVVFENNELSYNGNESKICLTRNVIFRNNHVHHNVNGIWYDGENTGSLIEGNVIEDNDGQGVYYEVSGQGLIRNNIVRRNGGNGIFITNSHAVEIYGNVLENNFRGIAYFVDCAREYLPYPTCNYVGEQCYTANIAAHDNVTLVGPGPGALASGFSYSNCSAAELAPFSAGERNLTFTGNHYFTPSTGSSSWYWAGVAKDWGQWQALGRDPTGSLQPSSQYP